MTDESLLLPLRFSNSVNKYALIPWHFQLFFDHGNLKDLIVNYRMHGLDEMNKEWTPLIHRGKSPDEIRTLIAEQRSKMEANVHQEVGEYLPILFDQALVMI